MVLQIIDSAFFARAIVEIILAVGAIWISRRTGSDSITKISIIIGIVLFVLGIIDMKKGVIW